MDSLILDLVDAGRVIRRDFDRRAASLESSRAQWRLLARLARWGGARQVDLAEALEVEPMTLCRMVDRMEAAGLVERRRDEGDRRAWQVHLTDAAAPVVERLRALAGTFYDDALAGVGEDEMATVRRVLARIRDNLAEAGSPARKAL